MALLMNPASNAIHADLISLWEFDFEGAADSCGENHGTLEGYPDFSAGHAGIDRALELSGDGYVSIANKWNFDITNEITVAAWIKVNKFDKQWQAIVTKGDSAWRLGRTSTENTLAFHLTGVTSENNGVHQNLGVEGNMNVDDGRWHHATGVYDGSKVYLYVDGILDKSLGALGTIETNSYNVYIGENAEQKGRYFDGLIDDVAIFDHALSENDVKQLYDKGGASFIPKGYMATLVEEAETLVNDLKPQEAIVLIEKKIAEYEEWRARNIDDIRLCDRRLSSDMYVLLARAKEAADASARDVIAAYRLSVSHPPKRSNHIPAALLWLFEKTPKDEYIDVVKECVRNSDDPFYNIYHIAGHFESSGNWVAFKLLLDAVFSQARDTTSCAKAVANGLQKDGVWAGKFLEYCRSKPELTEYLFHKHEKIARKYIARKNSGKAAEVYRDIIGQCGPNQEKAGYELKLHECLLNEGKYDTVVQNIDRFIKNNKATQRVLISKAIMLKGRAHVQLGDIDRATDAFFALTIEHPETKQAAEANFFVGYCYMLQGRFDEAAEAFNIVVKDYPESSYASKASSSLIRIKDMTE
jgi:tetratricopeptide (TPR) repeat protein